MTPVCSSRRSRSCTVVRESPNFRARAETGSRALSWRSEISSWSLGVSEGMFRHISGKYVKVTAVSPFRRKSPYSNLRLYRTLFQRAQFEGEEMKQPNENSEPNVASLKREFRSRSGRTGSAQLFTDAADLSLKLNPRESVFCFSSDALRA